MLKDIMVHLDQSPDCATRIDAALLLAKRYKAFLTGLYVYSSPRQNNPEQQKTAVRDLFSQKAAEAGLATEWIEEDLGFSAVGIAELVGYYASFADLLIVSQPGVADRHKQYMQLVGPERLLLGSARPVLVMPSVTRFATLAERIMVAWKAGPKASRALHDALPLMQSAKYVSIVGVGDSTFSQNEEHQLLRYLSRHDVQAKVELLPQMDLKVGEVLLNQVAEDHIDLLVLGVHITSRRGHLDMGPIGSHLLRQMTVPMMLSH